MQPETRPSLIGQILAGVAIRRVAIVLAVIFAVLLAVPLVIVSPVFVLSVPIMWPALVALGFFLAGRRRRGLTVVEYLRTLVACREVLTRRQWLTAAVTFVVATGISLVLGDLFWAVQAGVGIAGSYVVVLLGREAW